MYVSERDLLVRKEQCQDLLRQAEQERLAGAVAPPAGAGPGLLRKIAGWFSPARKGAEHPPLPTLRPVLHK